jgi:hypothetical protein
MTTNEPTPVAQRRQFVREKKWVMLAISVAMIVPCLWHRRIEAGDLGSHVYNAWLAQLIEKGQGPGLYLVRQWNNVLFDWTLQHAANVMGFAAAEKIVVSACVLVFFWGVFALVAAASGQPPWFLTPCIAMLAYGYSFNMGFLNYYLSLGLASFSLALLWRGRGVERLIGLLLVPFVLLAHPLGFVYLVGTALFVLLWTNLPKWWNWMVLPVAVAALLVVRWYLAHRAQFPVDWSDTPFYLLNGADQLALYGQRYVWLAWTAVLFGIFSFVFQTRASRDDKAALKLLILPLQLYFVAICAIALLPEDLRPSLYGGWIGLLVYRLTTISAIFGLCVLACLRPKKWQSAGFLAVAIVFFVFLYQDTKALSRTESNAEKLLSGLPYGTRVIPTIGAPDDSRVQFIGHLVDRACIGRCFTYSNYEPSSGQFRVRARKGSPVATDSADDSSDMEGGSYKVQATDLPLVQIYQCDEDDPTHLCLHNLVEGETTGQVGLHPPTPPKSGNPAESDNPPK